jgi:hypothetical protein
MPRVSSRNAAQLSSRFLRNVDVDVDVVVSVDGDGDGDVGGSQDIADTFSGLQALTGVAS